MYRQIVVNQQYATLNKLNKSGRQFQRLIARTWNECKNAEVWHTGIVKERLFVRRDNRVFILNKDAGLIRVLLDKIL